MKKAVQTICYFINLYIFFVVICGFMTAIPNLNLNFIPLRIMFLMSGFGIQTKYALLSLFMPLIIIISLIAVRKLLYKLIGEKDKFFDYETEPEKKEKDNNKTETNNEDIDNGSENTDSTNNNN